MPFVDAELLSLWLQQLGIHVRESAILSVASVILARMAAESRDLAWLVMFQEAVVSREQALALGLTDGGLRHRIRQGGPWRRLLPGVYLAATGIPSTRQRYIAASLFGGPESVLTGPAALSQYKIGAERSRLVDVMVPAERKRASHSFVAVHRTSRMPQAVTCDGPLRYALPARAVADTLCVCRPLTLPDARAIVAGAVQNNRCTVAELGAELAGAPTRGSAQLRFVLAEVADGIRSAAEADFRTLIRKSGLPQPLFNPSLLINGKLLARPDAWWPEHGVVAEVDSRAWHLAPALWEATMSRHSRMTAFGIRVLHFSPRQVRRTPGEVLDDVAVALRTGEPIPGLVTVPAAA